MIGAIRRRLRGRGAHHGSAVIEFVFGAVLVFIPLVYLIVAVASLQRSNLAVTNAARDVGRAIATSGGAGATDARAQAALRIALENEDMAVSDVQLRYTTVGAGCQGVAIEPTLAPGTSFAVCVIRHVRLPAVPTIVSGRGITSIGRFVVHMDDYRLGSG